jgi:hypothetical protein
MREMHGLVVREEHRLIILDNMVLRKILGPKKDKITWEGRKLYNDLYSSPNYGGQMKKDEMGRSGGIYVRINYWKTNVKTH